MMFKPILPRRMYCYYAVVLLLSFCKKNRFCYGLYCTPSCIQPMTSQHVHAHCSFHRINFTNFIFIELFMSYIVLLHIFLLNRQNISIDFTQQNFVLNYSRIQVFRSSKITNSPLQHILLFNENFVQNIPKNNCN